MRDTVQYPTSRKQLNCVQYQNKNKTVVLTKGRDWLRINRRFQLLIANLFFPQKVRNLKATKICA